MNWIELPNNELLKFIKDICNDKFTTFEDIKKIANDMNKNVVKHDKGRWYA